MSTKKTETREELEYQLAVVHAAFQAQKKELNELGDYIISLEDKIAAACGILASVEGDSK